MIHTKQQRVEPAPVVEELPGGVAGPAHENVGPGVARGQAHHVPGVVGEGELGHLVLNVPEDTRGVPWVQFATIKTPCCLATGPHTTK